MSRRLCGPLFVLLLVALPAARGRAETARSADPFAGLDRINLSAAIGGPLDLAGGTEPRLFAGDLRRFNHFMVNLTTALDAKLATCGLLVSPEVPDELSVEVFGRPENLRQCTPRYVYMIQVKVLNTSRAAGQAEPEYVPLRPVIGLAEEADLERSLIEAAVAAVAAELTCRP